MMNKVIEIRLPEDQLIRDLAFGHIAVLDGRLFGSPEYEGLHLRLNNGSWDGSQLYVELLVYNEEVRQLGPRVHIRRREVQLGGKTEASPMEFSHSSSDHKESMWIADLTVWLLAFAVEFARVLDEHDEDRIVREVDAAKAKWAEYEAEREAQNRTSVRIRKAFDDAYAYRRDHPLRVEVRYIGDFGDRAAITVRGELELPEDKPHVIRVSGDQIRAGAITHVKIQSVQFGAYKNAPNLNDTIRRIRREEGVEA